MIVRLTVCALALLLMGCSSSTGDTTAERSVPSLSPTASSTTSPPASAAPAIVGEWQRLEKCSELVGNLEKAGLKNRVLSSIAGDDWIPGVSKPDQIKDPSHPCRGAVARKHSHFFAADGEFGSRDENGQQVDGDSYELVGKDVVQIGKVKFHYKIAGDTLRLTPEIPKCRPDCFEAEWSVAVAYEGYDWQRIA
jgi:hypothetical protein